MKCNYISLSRNNEFSYLINYREGYLRLSSEEFSLEGDGVFNKFIHLTNNAVQKYSNCYGQHEKGNQLSFKDFEDYMKEHNLNGDFKGKILPRMKELVKYSMLSVFNVKIFVYFIGR